ncbi:hypothetical protein PENTCL1PPCAC_10035, partial [Pristionchus entomophagus]
AMATRMMPTSRTRQNIRRGMRDYGEIQQMAESPQINNSSGALSLANYETTALATLIFVAAIIAASLETCLENLYTDIFPMLLPVGCAMSFTLLRKKHWPSSSMVAGMSVCLSLFTVSISVLTALCLQSKAALLLPFRVLALSLGLPLLGACMRDEEKIHIALTSVFVLPTITLAIAIKQLGTVFGFALLIPALTLFSYKTTALVCSNYKLPRRKDLMKTLLLYAAASMLMGAMVPAAAVAMELQQTKLTVGGFVVALAGCIAFNGLLVVLRWEERQAPVDNEKELIAKMKLIALLFLTVFVSVAIYPCLEYFRLIVPPLIALLVCLYFALVYIHNRIRRMTSKCLHISLVLISFVVTSLSMWKSQAIGGKVPAGAPLFETCNGLAINTTVHELTPYDKGEIDKQETLWFIALIGCLNFVYWMMTSLIETDQQSKQACAAAASRPCEEGVELHPTAAAAETAAATAAAAARAAEIAARNAAADARSAADSARAANEAVKNNAAIVPKPVYDPSGKILEVPD